MTDAASPPADPPLSVHDEEAIDSYRATIERLLEGPSSGVADALLSYMIDTVRINVDAAYERGTVAAREAAAARRGDAIRKAKEAGVLDLAAMARDIARAFDGIATIGAVSHVVGILAEMMQLQRDTDRSILVAEANRRLSVAHNFPDLVGPAEASATALSFGAGLIEAGLVPEQVARFVAEMSTTRRAQPTKKQIEAAVKEAIGLLVEVRSREQAEAGNAVVMPRVAVTEGPRGLRVSHVVGDTERVYEADDAIDLGLALVVQGFRARAEKKAQRRGR